MSSPEIRFPEFADEWKQVPLHTLMDRVREEIDLDPHETYTEIGVRSHCRGVFHKEPTTASEIGAKRVFPVVPNTLVFNIVFAWEQAVAVLGEQEAGMIASHRFPMFRANPKTANLEFLERVFQRKRGKHILELASPGGAGRNKTLNIGELLKFKIAAPTRAEQEKIAAFLQAVDARLRGLRREKALLTDYKTGLMQKIFSQEIRFRADDGSAFPEWDEVELGSVLAYVQPTKYLVKTKDYSDAFETPVLTAGKTFILGYTDEKDGIFEPKVPVIIFDDFTTNSQYVDFPFKLKSSAAKILKLKKEGGQMRLLFNLLQQIEYSPKDHQRHWIQDFQYRTIPWPHPDEQRKIADALGAMDAKISDVGAQIEKLETFKQGLLQKMFV
ncbi:type I restriction enzyme, S subunit [Ruegeria intermedia]|uniref:Type I restriction enzyme, S subunit n=1 Tax=Ruegeria intermedia TaxID=996115 RepID=A0A1M5BVH9_9RHOB|nr:restriction endonuclease subunit S [Ruegeria intermedia]SHF46242.1 type I restriction enzyme, S subunit [Ruegeria intermedia]